jgi:uncharacterized protein
MQEAETFEIQMNPGRVRGTLHRPAADPPWRTVVMCSGVHVAEEDAVAFFDDLTDRLCQGGLAVARFEARCADLILEDFHAHCSAHDFEDAAAVHRWLIERPEIDRNHLGAIGYSLGALPASMLARRSPHLWRLCLISPTTAADISNRMIKGDGIPAVINPEHLPAAFVPSLAGIDSAQDAAFHARPTLLLHGAADRFVPPEVSFEYVRAFEHARRPAQHILVARADHTFSTDYTRASCLDEIERFFPIVDETSEAALAGMME